MEIICFHGFLGRPGDWKSLSLEQEIDAAFSYPDLFADSAGILPYCDWAGNFSSHYKDSSSNRFLIGYSLGGRLALHAVLHNPGLYRGVVLISSHYGLSSPPEKAERLAADRRWAKRFRAEEWGILMRDWDSQPVFRGDAHPFQRKEKEFSRETLAQALEVWSLANQENLKEQLEKLSIPILFIAGKEDVRYAALAETLRFSNSHSACWIAEGAGHRVPWQQPEAFRRRLSDFIKR